MTRSFLRWFRTNQSASRQQITGFIIWSLIAAVCLAGVCVGIVYGWGRA